MSIRYFLFASALVCGLLAGGGAEVSGQVTPDGKSIYARDPFVVADKSDSAYYVIKSATKDGLGALMAYRSKDLKKWEEAGYVFTASPDYPAKDDWWAPDTYLYKGKYYIFVTVSNESAGILRGTTALRSDSGIMGPYRTNVSDKRIFLTPKGMQCLDGSLFVDDSGKPWIVFAVEWIGPNVENMVGEVWAQRLDRNLTRPVGKPHRLFKASEAPWVKVIGPGGKGMVTDAPFIWKDDASGNLILVWSSFSPEYTIGQAISRNGVLGPWEQVAEPVFKDDGGHQMIFRDFDGNLKMSFHSPNNHTDGRRETMVIKDIEIKDGKIFIKP